MITEEYITIAAAQKLIKEGWEIILVHPPDGQGPFTIPKPPQNKAIERASNHPDIVAIKKEYERIKIILVECKVKKCDLKEDIEKFKNLANNPDQLYYICFRCQKFECGPELGVDYDELSTKSASELPIEFAFAYQENTGSLELPTTISGFPCQEFSFTETEISPHSTTSME
ncbi:MAG: hypothetical protein JXA00_00805 [Candidatus Thermoplasmatota archaeon]|nr:hypothetical protein [Candidatus Thermoplasmatota archaeon]